MFLRLALLVIGLASSYIGSLCFQTGSGSDMAVGGGAILIGILSFFFLGKGLWRFLGCMSTFVLMAVIVAVLFFFVCCPTGTPAVLPPNLHLLPRTTSSAEGRRSLSSWA